MHRTPMPWTGEIGMSDDPHLPTPLAHGRWAGDRVGHSAREAGASLKTLSKRATLTEQSGTDSAHYKTPSLGPSLGPAFGLGGCLGGI